MECSSYEICRKSSLIYTCSRKYMSGDLVNKAYSEIKNKVMKSGECRKN